MFDKPQFVSDCKAALHSNDPRAVITELVTAAIADPDSLQQGLGEPTHAGLDTLYQAPDLTILNVIWGPGMAMRPHNHQIWAVIGVYAGCEENVFFRREEDGLRQFGSKTLNAGDTIPLGESVIHGVTNPLDAMTGALHIYGGDFFAQPRSEWDPETFTESPYDVEHTLKVFAESNRRLSAGNRDG